MESMEMIYMVGVLWCIVGIGIAVALIGVGIMAAYMDIVARIIIWRRNRRR